MYQKVSTTQVHIVHKSIGTMDRFTYCSVCVCEALNLILSIQKFLLVREVNCIFVDNLSFEIREFV